MWNTGKFCTIFPRVLSFLRFGYLIELWETPSWTLMNDSTKILCIKFTMPKQSASTVREDVR